MNLWKADNPLILVGWIILALILGFFMSAFDERYSLVLFALAVGGLLAMIVFFSPRLGFYILVISVTLNRYEIPFAGGHLRIDQVILMPVLFGVLLRLAMVYPNPLYRSRSYPQPTGVSLTVIAGLALYIALNVLSSFLFSPQPAESLKIVVWLLLSFATLATAYLVVGRYLSAQEAFYAVLGAGFVSGAVGVLLFVLFYATGATFGIQQDLVTHNYSATGTFFEANIFGSFQAFSAVAAIAFLNSRRPWVRDSPWLIIGTGLSILALALSFTRAAWLAFMVGLLVLFLLQLRGARSLALLVRAFALTLVILIALIPTGLLANLATRFTSITDFSSGTIAYRLERVEWALADWSSSPILGLGTNSFSQRHLNPTLNYEAPDYLGSLFLATLYDIGIVGLVTFLVVFGVLIGALFRMVLKNPGSRQGNIALALLCGLVSLLVSYQATNAWWFGYNWIILAIAIRLYEEWRLALRIRYFVGTSVKHPNPASSTSI